MAWLTVLLSLSYLLPAVTSAGILKDPGRLCQGQAAVLTCNITGGQQLIWFYFPGLVENSMPISTTNIMSTVPPSAHIIIMFGITFTVSYLSARPHLVSQISFLVEGGGSVVCGGTDGAGAFLESDTITLNVENSAGPSDVRLSGFMNGSISSNVTIEWTPPTNSTGNDVTYTVGTTPPPLSPPNVTVMINTSAITVSYNTRYTVTVSRNTCDGEKQANTTFSLVGCGVPLVSSGVVMMLNATSEGAEVLYQCGPGLLPQNMVTSLCTGNGQWTPDTSLHICTVSCTLSEFPSNGSASAPAFTSVGVVVTFQCDEGLIPSHPITTTCTNTNQWTLNPADIQCSTEVSTGPGGSSTSTISPDTVGSTTPPPGLGTDPRNTNAPIAVFVAVPVVVVVLAVGILVVMVVLVIYRRHMSGTSKGDISKHGMELQQAPMEYSTLSTRGYESDNLKDMYSVVQQHTATRGQPSSESPPFPGAEYSTLATGTRQANCNGAPPPPRKGKQPQPPTEEYAEVNKNKPAAEANQPTEEYAQVNKSKNVSGGMIYADVGHIPVRATDLTVPIVDDDKVVYSDINPKASAPQVPNADASLDLNMMLIQVRAVIPKWYEYGEALGAPHETLEQVREMNMGDYDKLVEILDSWFRKFPRGSSPTWKDVAEALQMVGLKKLAADIMKVYTTGQLPISVTDEVPREAYGGDNAPPPPLPPKIEDSEDLTASLLPVPPKPTPRAGSLKQPPPRPPKQNMSPGVPARPPKSSTVPPPKDLPARPPKPGHD